MARHAKTLHIVAQAYEVLDQWHPMTLRQIFYQLVSRQVLENTRLRYQALSRHLVSARADGTIPYDWIEDRLRETRGGGDGWESVQSFLDYKVEMMGYGYHAAIWPTQPRRLEVWLEKDALSNIFEDALANYNIGLNVGRGYNSLTAIYNAAQRIARYEQPVTVLYFGDFDPSGEDMFRDLQERLADLGAEPEMEKVALSRDDIERYSLPPNFTKADDSRAKKHIAKHGDISVELDALPPDVLNARIIESVEQHMDMEALHLARVNEGYDKNWLAEQVAEIRAQLGR